MLIPDILGYGLICYFVVMPIAMVITACRRSEELKEIKDKIEGFNPKVSGSFIHDSIDNLLFAIRSDKENHFPCRVTSILKEVDQKELLKRLVKLKEVDQKELLKRLAKLRRSFQKPTSNKT